ncbi:MAG: glycosyltransferase family 87 protein [Vicinamibacterales bacterium]
MQSASQVSWSALLVEPIALTLAIVWIALAYSVVLRPPEINAADFYTFWDSARWYREGLDPYLHQAPRYGLGYNLNVPAAVLFFLPFSLLDLVPAFVIWTTMSVALFAYAGWRIAVVTGYERRLLVVCALFISQSIFTSLQLGQMTAIIMIVFTEAWIADRQPPSPNGVVGPRHRPLTAGALLGVVIGFKPLLAPFALYALWRSSLPLITGMLAGIAAIWLAGLLLMGTAGYRSWFDVLQRVTWSAQLSNGSLLAALQRLFTTVPDLTITPLGLHDNWISPLWWTLTVMVAAIGFRAIAGDRDREWLIVLLGSLLVSPLGWVYYVPLAAGPLAAHLRRASTRARWVAGVGYAFLCIPYTVMNGAYGVLLSLVVSSASTWGILALYSAAAIGAEKRAR